jgi:hypothetical protein
MRALQRELGKELGSPGGIGSNQHVKKSKGANGTLAKDSKRGSNKSDYLLSRLKRDVPEAVKGGRELRSGPGAPEGSRNNPMGRAGKTNPDNIRISSKEYGTSADYLTARLKRDNPEILEGLKNGEFK